MRVAFRNIKLIALTILILLLIFSYHPYVLSTITDSGGSILSRYVMLMFIILFILTFRLGVIIKSKVIITLFLLIFFFAIKLSLTILWGFNINVVNAIRPLIITAMAISIGWNLKLSVRELTFFVILYSLGVLVISIQNVLIHIGSFTILEEYATQIKNSIGVILASSGITLYYYSQCKETSKINRVILIILTVLAIIALLTLRARTATLALLLTAFFIQYKKSAIKIKSIYVSMFVTLLSGVIIYVLLPSSAKEFIYQSFTLNTSHNITTGRIDRNIQGLEFISNNLLLGNLNGKGSVPLIHNFVLLQIYRYGIVFSVGILAFYFYLLCKVIKGTFSRSIFEPQKIGYVILLAPFLISFAEPNIPFGPGTVSVFNFIIYGITLRYECNKRQLFYAIK